LGYNKRVIDPDLLQIVFAFQPEAQLMNPHVPHKDFTFFAIKAARQVLNRGCVMNAVVNSNIVIALLNPLLSGGTFSNVID
jgi:hypothetical protein